MSAPADYVMAVDANVGLDEVMPAVLTHQRGKGDDEPAAVEVVAPEHLGGSRMRMSPAQATVLMRALILALASVKADAGDTPAHLTVARGVYEDGRAYAALFNDGAAVLIPKRMCGVVARALLAIAEEM